MNDFFPLVGLFLKDLVRRKSLWIIVAIVCGIVLISFLVNKTMEDLVASGVRYDVATRRAIGQLDVFVSTVRSWVVVSVVLVAALVAPESRRNGTTQFVLTMQVSRIRLACAQFCALCVFVTAGVVLVHAGYCITAWRFEHLDVAEAALSWVYLWVPCIAVAAAVFAVSLVSSVIETYVVFLGLPLVLDAVLAFTGSARNAILTPVAIFAENARLLFPDFAELIFWPQVTMVTERPPHPEWSWWALSGAFAVLFWLILGWYRYANHEFGSRTAIK